jgi:hypothetical protein
MTPFGTRRFAATVTLEVAREARVGHRAVFTRFSTTDDRLADATRACGERIMNRIHGSRTAGAGLRAALWERLHRSHP